MKGRRSVELEKTGVDLRRSLLEKKSEKGGRPLCEDGDSVLRQLFSTL